MSIVREDNRMQITCDFCPAAYPNTYVAEDFTVMVADAKAAGWSIRKRPVDPSRDRDTSDLFGGPPRVSGGRKPDPYIHACPACVREQQHGSLI